MVVSDSFSSNMSTDIFPLTGRHHTCTKTVKEEPGSPAKLATKHRIYSTSGSNLIGNIKILGEADISQGTFKRQKTSTVGTAHV
jgi:hypothetical protein